METSAEVDALFESIDDNGLDTSDVVQKLTEVLFETYGLEVRTLHPILGLQFLYPEHTRWFSDPVRQQHVWEHLFACIE